MNDIAVLSLGKKMAYLSFCKFKIKSFVIAALGPVLYNITNP
jgi:hypothetical protein